MYTDHFNLVKRPFSRVPSANGCVMYPGMKSCFERASQGIDECAGPVLVVGPSGTGKSTLLALLENRFAGNLTVVTLNCATIDTRQELIQCLLFELDLPLGSDNVGELRLKLIDHLKSPERCPHGLLLLVDEAHNLPLGVLEELRMITNMVCGSQHQIRLVVAGGRPLEEKLAHPQLESFSQRIGVRCYLQSMTRTETMFFTLAQLQMCGRDGREIFQPSALEKIFDITDGVPRLVAHLSDHTLKMAMQKERQTIDAKLVQKAWLDLQQLPALPEVEAFEGQTATGIIEFGSLDEPVHDSTDSWASPAAGKVDREPAPLASALATDRRGNESWPSDDDDQDLAPPVDSTLDSLLRHLNEIENTQAEEDAGAAPQQDGSKDPPAELPVSGLARVETTIDIRELQGFQEFQQLQNQNQEHPQGHGDSRFTPAVAADPDPTVTQVFPSAEVQPQRDPIREPPPATGSQPAEWDPTRTQPIPDLRSRGTPSVEMEHEKTLPPNPFVVSDDSSRTISTEELFGSSFDDEPVMDAQASLLAAQNRLSSSMTFGEVAELRPLEGQTPSHEPEDRSQPETAVPEVAIADASPNSSDRARPVLEEAAASTTSQPPAVDVTQTWNDIQISISNSGSAQRVAADKLDDSDMLIVEQRQISPDDEADAAADPAPPTSQGQVIRMDYEDLFAQLRNQNPGGSQT